MYKITIKVKGDHIAPDFKEVGEYDVETIDDLVVQSWDQYRRAMHFVWKDMESGLFLEPRPNKLMSIECSCNDGPVDEMDVFEAFHKIRIARAVNTVEHFKVPT